MDGVKFEYYVIYLPFQDHIVLLRSGSVIFHFEFQNKHKVRGEGEAKYCRMQMPF